MELQKLPKPDGEPFKCTVDINISTWPYIKRCTNKAAGLLPFHVYATVPNMGGRLICQEHFNILVQERA